MTFEEAVPVEVVPEIDDTPVDDVEPEVVEVEPVVDEPAPEVFEIEIYAKPISSDEVNTVNARELHKKLKCSERFSTWFERQLSYGFSEGVDFCGCKTFNTQANQELDDYFISLDMAKEVSMIQRSEQGKIARRYFIECEKIAKGEIPKVEPKPESSLIENMKAASEVIDVTMTMLSRLGIAMPLS